MKKMNKSPMAVIISLVLAVNCFILTAFAEGNTDSNNIDNGLLNDGQMNLDVVFVLDASGSMTNADPKKTAVDAYQLFVDLLDDTCGIGYVVYTHELKDKGEIVQVDDKQTLENTKKKIAAVEYDLQGFTDISLGLTEAKNMLIDDNIKNDHRRKAIILLTDGNTALPEGGRSIEKSNDEMDITLSELYDYHIPVYCVGLNYNGKMEKNELQRIADETTGLRYETKSSEDLPGIFSDVFGNIYQLEGEQKEIVDGKVDIRVSDSTVFTVSIIIRSAFSLQELNPVLENPRKEQVTLHNNPDITVSSTGSYTMIKMFYPDAGDWVLHLDKVNNDNCIVTQMDYYSVFIEQTLEANRPNQQPMALKATVNNKEGILEDRQLLNTISMKTVITDQNGSQTEIPMTMGKTGVYTAEWTPSTVGKYKIIAVAQTPKFTKSSEEKTVTVMSPEEYEKLMQGTSAADSTLNDEDDGNSYWVIMAILIGLIVVGGGVALFVILVGKKRQPEQEEEHKEPPVIQPAPMQPRKVEPEPRIILPKATDPVLVDYQKIEHDSLENLIKKGPEDAFSLKSDNIKTDYELESLIKKGPDNAFGTGFAGDTLLMEEQDEYDDEYGDDEDEYDEDEYDEDEYDEDEYDDGDDSPLKGVSLRKD